MLEVNFVFCLTKMSLLLFLKDKVPGYTVAGCYVFSPYSDDFSSIFFSIIVACEKSGVHLIGIPF